MIFFLLPIFILGDYKSTITLGSINRPWTFVWDHENTLTILLRLSFTMRDHTQTVVEILIHIFHLIGCVWSESSSVRGGQKGCQFDLFSDPLLRFWDHLWLFGTPCENFGSSKNNGNPMSGVSGTIKLFCSIWNPNFILHFWHNADKQMPLGNPDYYRTFIPYPLYLPYPPYLPYPKQTNAQVWR